MIHLEIAIIAPVCWYCANAEDVQEMRDVKWGLFGMVVSCWGLVLAILFKDSGEYWKISYYLYHISICTLPLFLMLSASYSNDYYVQLHREDMPFSIFHGYVIPVGLVHLALALCCLGQRNLPELFSLLIASFFFSVDLYSVWTTKTYMICRHYHYKWQSTPEKELLYNVGKAEIAFVEWKEEGNVIVV